jgi:hypothetical protein
MKRMWLGEIESHSDINELLEFSPEQMARQMVSKMLSEAYVHGLASWAKAAPDPRGMADYYRGRYTKAARRYEKWQEEQALEAVKEVEEQLIEQGVYELVIGEDGREYLKKGSNYEEYYRERGMEPPV